MMTREVKERLIKCAISTPEENPFIDEDTADLCKIACITMLRDAEVISQNECIAMLTKIVLTKHSKGEEKRVRGLEDDHS